MSHRSLFKPGCFKTASLKRLLRIKTGMQVQLFIGSDKKFRCPLRSKLIDKFAGTHCTNSFRMHIIRQLPGVAEGQ